MSNYQNSEWYQTGVEIENEWNQMYCIWKSFNNEQHVLLKSYLGLCAFGIQNDSNEIDPNTYYDCFDEDKKKTIDSIYDKLQFEQDQIILAHTNLYLSDNGIVCVFRQMKNNSDVIFIDCEGRVYRSWEHFVETNELPKCEYIAPIDGIHNVNGELCHYRSPTENPKEKLKKIGDIVSTGACIGAIGLGALAMAPATATVLGVSGVAYGVGRSIGTLVDRSEHEQSVGLNNFESFVSWLNIGTTALSGISTVGLANSFRIVQMSGKYSTLATRALKGLNYMTLGSAVFNFGTYLVYFQRKLKNEELSSMDMLELCVNAFLVWGAVSNVRQMRNYLNNLETNAKPKTLTKSAKRRLRRMHAKLAKQGITSNKGEVMKVTSLDACITPGFNGLISASGQILRRKFPSTERIYYTCLNIIQTVRSFRSGALSQSAFVSNLINHGYNLHKLLQYEFENMKKEVTDFLRSLFGVNPSSQLTNDVVNILNDAVETMNVNGNVQRIDESEESDSQNENTSDKYLIVLDLAKRKASNRQWKGGDDVKFVSSFVEDLETVVIEIISDIDASYDEFIANNYDIVGEKMTKIMLSRNGINCKREFADKRFLEIIRKVEMGNLSTFNCYVDKFQDFISSVFSSIEKDLDVVKTCEIFTMIMPTLKSIASDVTKYVKFMYYNCGTLGLNDSLLMLNTAFDLNIEDFSRKPNVIEFFDLTVEKVDLSPFTDKIRNLIDEKETNTSDETFSDDYKFATLISLCQSFYESVYKTPASFNLEENNFKKVCFFIVDKLLSEFQSIGEKESEIKGISQKLFDRKELTKIHIILGECLNNMRKREIFDSVLEKFMEKENRKCLVKEYNEEMSGIPNLDIEVCKNIAGDDGMKMFCLEIGKYCTITKYKEIAAHLFDVSLGNFSFIDKKENLIVLKHSNKYVIFSQNENNDETLIMQVDELAQMNESVN